MGSLRRARLLPTVVLSALLGAGCSESSGAGKNPPRARLQLPARAFVGQVLVFDGSASTAPDRRLLRYRWRFGDGAPDLETASPQTRHRYDRMGDFIVCLWVIDPQGLSNQRCEVLAVRFAPDSGIPDGPPDLLAPDQLPDAGPDLGDGGVDGGDAAVDAGDAGVEADADAGDAGGDAADGGADGALDASDAAQDVTPDITPDVGVDAATDLGVDAATDLGVDATTDASLGACLATVTGGSGAGGYNRTFPADPCLIDVSAFGSKLNITKDDQGTLTLLPFSFSYFGVAKSAVGVSSNGYLQFPGAPLQLTANVPSPLPNATAPNNVVAAFWDNLAPLGATTNIYLATLRQTPNRVFVVQWEDWSFLGLPAGTRLRFTVRLFETSNVIELSYLVLDGGNRAKGSQASVGIENATGTLGIQHSLQMPALTAGQTVRFTPL
ncbi:MAG: hypothetical protein CSA65_09740 [Proteobacteria bacterium]|nr:MAG: hypothetical protein CSA65_09740 [Pseudomonadota bacterium]